MVSMYLRFYLKKNNKQQTKTGKKESSFFTIDSHAASICSLLKVCEKCSELFSYLLSYYLSFKEKNTPKLFRTMG